MYHGYTGGNIGVRLVMKIDTAKLRASLTPPADADRAIAEWVLRIGGVIRTDEDYNKEVKVIEEFPKKPFKLTQINLVDNKQVTDDDLKTLKELKNLSILI